MNQLVAVMTEEKIRQYILEGYPAFDGESQSKVIAALLDHEPPPVSARQPLASPALASPVLPAWPAMAAWPE